MKSDNTFTPFDTFCSTEWMSPLCISLLYLLFGTLWILVSDHVAAGIASSEEQLHFFSNIKGWLFICATALMLFMVLRKNARKIDIHMQQLAESQAHLKAAQMTALIGSWEQDGKTGALVWSDKVYGLFGFDPKTTKPSIKLFLDTVHPDDQKRVAEAFQNSLNPEAPSYDIVHRIIRADNGNILFIHERCTHLWDATGNVIKSVGTVQDITALKRAEMDLAQSNKLLGDVLDAMPDMMWLKDGSGKYLLCNHRFEQFFDEEKENIAGHDDYDFMNRDLADFFRGHDRKAIENNAPTTNEEWVTFGSDGHRELLETIKTPVYDHGGQLIGVLGIGRDITERKKQEQELEENRATLQAAMDHSQAGIAIADAPDGKLRYVNNAGLMIRGKGEEEIVRGIGIKQYVESWQILHLDGTPYEEDEVPLARAVLYGETNSVEFIIRRADNKDRKVWANAAPIKNEQGKVTAGIVIFLDISDLRKATSDLEIALERYRLLADNTLDIIWVMDPELNFKYVNSAINTITGYSPDEWIGSNLSEHCDEANFNLMRTMVLQELEKGDESTGVMFEADLLKKNGQPFTAEIRGKIIFDKHGNPTSLQGTTRDVSERRQFMEELAQHRDQLEKRVDERTEELRTMVNAMAGREVRMAELKEEIATLKTRPGNAGETLPKTTD